MTQETSRDGLPDIYAIAEKAGVSPATVSNIFHNRTGRFSPATARKVLRIAKQEGYEPNARASSLASRSSRNIGLVYYPDFGKISNIFYAKVTEGLATELNRRGYKASFTVLSDKDRLPHIIQRKDADGLVIVTYVPPHVLTDLQQFHVPAVLITTNKAYSGMDSVKTDNENCVSRLLDFLHGLGHKKIAFISWIGPSMDFEERLSIFRRLSPQTPDSFVKVAQKKGKKPDDLFDVGYRKTKELLSLKDRPSAIMAANDMIALGCLQACKDKGLDVPKEISITGCDDIDWAAYTVPGLTTLRVPRVEMGIAAVDLLMARIGNPNRPFENRLIQTELVQRGSCAKV